MYQQILVATDGSEMSSRAVATAARLAHLTGARLEVISVKEPFPYSAISELQPVPPQAFYDAQERLASRHIAAAQDTSREQGVQASGTSVEALHPWEAILELAKACDLIVMASHGRSCLGALLLGSETQKVLAHSTVPVLVIR